MSIKQTLPKFAGWEYNMHIMSLADRVAEIEAYENSKRARESEVAKKAQEKSRAKAQAENIEKQKAIEANTKSFLPLLDVITDTRGLIEEVQQIWSIGKIHESRHINEFPSQSSASISLSHAFLELVPLYRGTRDEGTDIGPRTGARIFQSGVSLSISVHTSGSGTGRPHAIVSYDKYKKTNGVYFPQRIGYSRQTAKEPWGPPASTNDRIGQPLVYGLKWIDIIIEDPKRTRDGVEYQLAKILSLVGSPSEYERLGRERIAEDPFVPRDVKRQLQPNPHTALPWYRRILG